jgi:hypothetical protein
MPRFPSWIPRPRAVGAPTGAAGRAARLDEEAFGPALIEAALDCAADVPSHRFVVCAPYAYP